MHLLIFALVARDRTDFNRFLEYYICYREEQYERRIGFFSERITKFTSIESMLLVHYVDSSAVDK